MITLYHNPFSRSATALWMLEELELDHERVFVDFREGAHKDPAFLAINPMGKLPTLVHDDVVITEAAAIGLYLADRFSAGSLAPALDDPSRGTYLRWMLYGPSVTEPCAYARRAGWDYDPSSAGWGTWEAMCATIDQAIGDGPWLLGDRFTMADVGFGATIRFMTLFGMLDRTPTTTAYIDRLEARDAFQRCQAINAALIEEHGLGG